MSNLKSTIIWLTGASSGIGEALAYELAARGASLALTARNKEALSVIAARIAAKGGAAVAMPGDVESLEEMKGIAVRIEQELGSPVQILVSNAGTHLFTKPEEFDSTEYLKLMNINYGGGLRCIEAVLPSMLKRRSGYIVGMASLAGYRGLPTAAAYGASKAAMINFLESLRFHVRRSGIAVSIVNPGFVKTPLTDKNPFKMPFLISAEKAARIIANGMERRKKEISFPFPFSWILKVARLLPYPIYERITDRLW